MSNNSFHFQGGLFFRRTQDDGVEIIQTDGYAIKKDETNIKWRVKIDKESWASIVSSVSNSVDPGKAYQEALEFHMKE